MAVNWLFLDMNSFFASVEQEEQPCLRGRPIAVAPVMTDRTCCIAASYEAKAFGIKTGMNVGEARQLCPGLMVVEARPDVYVRYHHRIIKAVDTVLPVEEVCSIDEMACRLGNGQQQPQQAISLAGRIKHVIREQLGEHVRCSVGLAPNKFLAKIAGNMQKPDGLTLLRPEDLPHKLYSLKLGDLTGIGSRMVVRLQRFGVQTVKQLYEQDRDHLQAIWNSVVGQQWWYLLRGYDLPSQPSRRRSVGHSHVLPPKFRTQEGARSILLRLIHKAASRLRRLDYWATRMSVRVSFIGPGRDWKVRSRLRPCQDTSMFVGLFSDAWQDFPLAGIPLKVSVTLGKLIPTRSTSPSLLADDRRRQAVAQAMDAINDRFGVDRLYLAAMHDARHTAPARIAFTHIPDVDAEGPTDSEELQDWEQGHDR